MILNYSMIKRNCIDYVSTYTWNVEARMTNQTKSNNQSILERSWKYSCFVMRLLLCALFIIDRSGSSTVLLPADKGSMVASRHQIWDPLESFSCMRQGSTFLPAPIQCKMLPLLPLCFSLSESSSAVLYKKWSDAKISKIGSLMLAGCIVAIVQGRLVSHGLVVLKHVTNSKMRQRPMYQV